MYCVIKGNIPRVINYMNLLTDQNYFFEVYSFKDNCLIYNAKNLPFLDIERHVDCALYEHCNLCHKYIYLYVYFSAYIALLKSF